MLSAVYLICSLPALSYGQKAPISIDEFLHDASCQLSKKQFAKLESINIQGVNKDVSSTKLNSFITLQTDIHEDIALIRRSKSEKQNFKPKTLSRSITDSNPLEREIAIMNLQWDSLSSIEFGESFSLTEIIIYKLKLQILERLSSFNTEKGAEIFASVVNPKIN